MCKRLDEIFETKIEVMDIKTLDYSKAQRRNIGNSE